MISMRKEREPNGYRVRSLVQEVGKSRDGALYQWQLDDDVTAFAVIDVTTEPMVTRNYVEEIIETLADNPDLLRSPPVVFESLNHRFCDDPMPVFASILVVSLDVATHRLTFSNAGSHPVYRRRKNGQIDDLGVDDIGFPLGIDHGLEWQRGDCEVEIGDTLLMLGVGMETALDTDSQSLGIDRMLEIYSSGGGVDEVALRIENAIAQHADPDAIESDRVGVLIERVS
jgi:serine phosphatase RsbU (regulator of sigma subunit)